MNSEELRSQLNQSLERTDLSIGSKYQGKVRDVYRSHEKMVIVATDRVSAFDHIIGTIPFRGQLLTQMALFWFKQTEDIIPNHVISAPDPNVMVVKECEAVPVEFVVRGYITGDSSTSLWKNYSEGNDVYKLNLPPGLQKHQKLEKPVITPTTKAKQGEHDTPITPDQIVAQGLLSQEDYDRLAGITLQLYARGTEIASKNGMILVDTKYEFGKKDGEFLLIDEIHTPDSSRFWYADSYQPGVDPKPLDKEYLRQWLLEQGFRGEGIPPALPDHVRIEAAQRYIETFEAITGQTFSGIPGPAEQRIRQVNL